MKSPRIVTATFALAALVVPPIVNADEVIDWNAIMQTTVAGGILDNYPR